MTRELNPGGSRSPLTSAASSGPYGPDSVATGGAANASRQNAGPKDTAAAVVKPDWINRRRVSMSHVYRARYRRAKDRSSGVTRWATRQVLSVLRHALDRLPQRNPGHR